MVFDLAAREFILANNRSNGSAIPMFQGRYLPD